MKHRKQTKQKQHKKKKGWAKGHSSDAVTPSSNYRQHASRLLGSKVTELSALGNEIGPGDDIGSNASDVESLASMFTACSNGSFRHVFANCRSGSTIHKEALCLLASVSETIRNKNGSETNTEYFAVLVSLLSPADAVNNAPTLAATSYLLSCVIGRVPGGVLQTQYESVVATLLCCAQSAHDQLCLSSASKPDMNLIYSVKFLLQSVGVILSNLQLSVWLNTSSLDFVKIVLSLTVSKFSTIKHAARKSLFKIVGNPLSEASAHPVATLIARHCLEQFEQFRGTADTERLVNALNIMSAMIHRFEFADVKSLAETTLKLLSHANSTVRRGCYSAFSALFETFSNKRIPISFYGRVTLALYDHQPAYNDLELTDAWASALVEAHRCLSALDSQISARALPRLETRLLKTISSTTSEAVRGCILKHLIAALESVMMVLESENSTIDDMKCEAGESLFDECLKPLLVVLEFDFLPHWPNVLGLLSCYFAVCGQALSDCSSFRLALEKIALIREDDTQRAHVTSLDRLVGAAVRSVGYEAVLRSLPFHRPHTDASGNFLDLRKSWLIPILISHTGSGTAPTSLTYFRDYNATGDENS